MGRQMAWELNYRFRLSDMTGTPDNCNFRNQQKQRKNNELAQLEEKKAEIIKAHYEDGETFDRLALIYNVSIYRIGQFFKLHGLNKKKA